MHPRRQPPPPSFPACPADSQTPASMDPSTDQASFPSSPPRMASQPLFQLSSMISHYETIPHMYPCLHPSCSVTLTRKIQPSTFPTFAFAPLCWKNQQYSLPTHVWEPEVGPERAACHHTTHSRPATLPFSSTPTSQLLWPQYPNNSPPHSWLRILPTSQRMEEIEENPAGSYPCVSPPVSAAGTCSASGLYISEEIPTTRRLTCSILNSQPVPWIRPTQLPKDIPPEPPPTLLERSRQLTDMPVFSSLKKNTHVKTFY